MERSEDTKFRSLRRFNAIMGVIHTAQGILMLALSSDFSLPIKSSFLQYDPISQAIVPVTKTIIDVPVGPAVALFLFISAIAHFSVSTFGYQWYVKSLKKHINPARWYEYALSSSVMLVVIAMLSGMFDIAALVLLFGLNATMNLFGLMMELHNQTTEKTSWTSFIYGSFAGGLAWIAVLIYFFGAFASDSNTIPLFLIGIMASLLFFWCTFPLNMVLQYKKVGKWKDYLYGERAYVILSLVSKTLLAWQVWAGTLRGA
ncbi:MAG: heliorhodopsin HeR [Methanomassiliicoccales archaeon]|nr:heliorhodopsin HeR [Methanomassiliicoccales archaeon]